MKYFVQLLMLILLITSCQNNETSVDFDGKTKNGFPYKFDVKNNNPRIDTGQWAYFRFAMLKNDSTELFPSSNRIEKFKLPNLDKLPRANGVVEGISLMGKDEKMTVFIHRDSMGMSLPDSTIEYYQAKIMMVDIKTQEEYQKELEIAQAEAKKLMDMEGAMGDQVNKEWKAYKRNSVAYATTESGLKYRIIEEGQGEQINSGDRVTALYYGVKLKDGEMFDNAYRAGRAFSFTVDGREVIKGWDESAKLFKKGTKAYIVLPPEIAYGSQDKGSIPANSTLMFYIEVLDK